VLYALALALSWLMVSKLPLMALKFTDFSLKNNLPKIILCANSYYCCRSFPMAGSSGDLHCLHYFIFAHKQKEK
jgi:hypothetical protein